VHIIAEANFVLVLLADVTGLGTGECKCFAGYSSSDHNSLEGTRRDCGKVNLLAIDTTAFNY
jgi:hypothetical protein